MTINRIAEAKITFPEIAAIFARGWRNNIVIIDFPWKREIAPYFLPATEPRYFGGYFAPGE